MFILHLALGGCLHAPPIAFGITADTGGHLAYVVDAAIAQAEDPDVRDVTIVTRLFVDPALSPRHSQPQEKISDKIKIIRIKTRDQRYLEKEALAADQADFTSAFCDYLMTLPQQPIVIHAHFADAAAVAHVAQQRFGIPFIYTPHTLGIDKRTHGVADVALDARIDAERSALGTASSIIVSTADEVERQVRAYGVRVEGRIHRLPPGVPRREAAYGAVTIPRHIREWLSNPSKPIILAIARPVRKKNLASLTRAFASSPPLRACANLVILAGLHDTPCSPEETGVLDELRALCDSPDLRGKVALPSSHDPYDVAALYAVAASGGVFINPALHEPFGLTLIEAAAAGTPVVATQNGGPGEILATIGHGILIDPTDDQAIAEACLSIISNPLLHARFSRAAMVNVCAYDWGRYATASISIYRSVSPGLPAVPICDIDNTLRHCIAASDSGDDLDMLEACGHGTVVANAGDKCAALTSRPGLEGPWCTNRLGYPCRKYAVQPS